MIQPMKISGLAFFGFMLIASTAMADNWDLTRNTLRLGIANVGWTVSEDFQTKKLLLDTNFVFERLDSSADEGKITEQLNYLFDVHLQFGNNPDKLDHAVVAYTYRAYQVSRNLRSSRSIQIVRDQLELASLITGYDDTLNVDYYTELEAGRVGRFWSYRPSDKSSFTVSLGLNASLGWAWTESVDTRYASVSNPVMGFWNVLILEHGRLGQLYFDRRVKNGFHFGIPDQSSAREANIRFGYRKDFSNCIAVDIFAEKRSFQYSSFDMPDLYDKTKRFGAQVVCQFL